MIDPRNPNWSLRCQYCGQIERGTFRVVRAWLNAHLQIPTCRALLEANVASRVN